MEYIIKSRPKIARNKYGYYTSSSSSSSGGGYSGGGSSSSSSVTLPDWLKYGATNTNSDGIQISGNTNFTGNIKLQYDGSDDDNFTNEQTPDLILLTEYDDDGEITSQTTIAPDNITLTGTLEAQGSTTLGSLTVAGTSKFVSSIDTYKINNSNLITTSSLSTTSLTATGKSVKLSGIDVVGNASSEVAYLTSWKSDGTIKHLPTNIYYKNNAIYVGAETGLDDANLNIYGNLYVSGTVEYQTLEADTASITKFTCGPQSTLGDKINLSDTNGNIVFDYGLAEGTAEYQDSVQFYGSPLVWHYDSTQKAWNDYTVLDLSMVTEAIDDTDYSDNVVTDRAVGAYVKDYVNANASAIIDISVLASNNGYTEDYRGIDLLKQPLYLLDPDTNAYCSAKIIDLGTSANPVYLEWEVYTSANTKTIYRIKLTNSTYGDYPWQTKEKIVAGNKQYRTETYNSKSTDFVGWTTVVEE